MLSTPFASGNLSCVCWISDVIRGPCDGLFIEKPGADCQGILSLQILNERTRGILRRFPAHGGGLIAGLLFNQIGGPSYPN
ncbi:MAG: hypothetical protein CM15mP60_1410 [Alphaproteobacteria bacterium]|nr:MAG: hypothetical protein CM15mP60_1410 [Alphaproteobacteria bacterium]